VQLITFRSITYCTCCYQCSFWETNTPLEFSNRYSKYSWTCFTSTTNITLKVCFTTTSEFEKNSCGILKFISSHQSQIIKNSGCNSGGVTQGYLDIPGVTIIFIATNRDVAVIMLWNFKWRSRQFTCIWDCNNPSDISLDS